MNSQKFNVVLIDDEKDFLDSYQAHLQDDFQVHSFTDPRHALFHLEKHGADAIVLDYHIPGRDASETFMEIRMRKFEQPVLFLTGEQIQELSSIASILE